VDIAASTTATGRAQIIKLRDFVDKDFGGTTEYGDTDSCFMTFPKLCVDEAGNKLKGKAAVAKCIELGQECSAAFQPLLDHPHQAEYEKTFFPFILLSKKRYVKTSVVSLLPQRHHVSKSTVTWHQQVTYSLVTIY
jgi:DNA polymerase elongation subunit (family B)